VGRKIYKGGKKRPMHSLYRSSESSDKGRIGLHEAFGAGRKKLKENISRGSGNRNGVEKKMPGSSIEIRTQLEVHVARA